MSMIRNFKTTFEKNDPHDLSQAVGTKIVKFTLQVYCSTFVCVYNILSILMIRLLQVPLTGQPMPTSMR